MGTLLFATVPCARTIDLIPGQHRRHLAADVRYRLVEGGVSEHLDATAKLPDAAFQPLNQRYIDFGYVPTSIWLSMNLRNAGHEGGRWKLSFNVRFMTEVVAYLQTADGGRLLLAQGEDATFAERPIPYRLLLADFELAPGERGRLLIGYRSKGSTALPVSFETEASLRARYGREDTINTAFYAAMGFMIVLSFLQFAFLAQRVQLGYALYLAATLAYIIHMDGLTFQYLWPHSPRWNSLAAVPLGLAMCIAVLNFSRRFIGTRNLVPRLDRCMRALMYLAAVMMLSALWLSESFLKGVSYWMASLSAGMCLAAGLIAYRKSQKAVRFYIIGWIGVFGGVFATTIVNTFPAIMARTGAVNIPKLTILFDSLMFAMALGDRARQLRRERDSATARELEALRRQHALSEQLHSAERARLEAMLQARRHEQKLATASHDIRQPLSALRLSVARMNDDGILESGLLDRFNTSIEYLDRLAKEYTSARSEIPAATRGSIAIADRVGGECFSTAMLLQNIELMFRDDAECKGLEFRCRAAAYEVRGDAMAAMRILSNLVTNALKYTTRGTVFIAARRRNEHVGLIVADTGPGIPEAELVEIFRERRRGSTAGDTEGSGLGLAIARQLAASCGYRLRVRSVLNKGTMFTLELPAG